MNYCSSLIARGGCSCTVACEILVPMTRDQTHIPCVGRGFFLLRFVCLFVCLAVLGLPCCGSGAFSTCREKGATVLLSTVLLSCTGFSLEWLLLGSVVVAHKA